ncbi:hypothetical protein HaLaN_19016, partial [Haematococcus lacustris]
GGPRGQHAHAPLRWQAQDVSVPGRGKGPAGHLRAPAQMTLAAGAVQPGEWHHAAGPGDQDVAGPGEAAAQGPVAGQQQAQLAGLVPAVPRHSPGDVRRHVGRGLEATLGQCQVRAVLWHEARGGNFLVQGGCGQ